MGFSLSLPVPGQPFASEGVKVGNDLTTISTWGNGNIADADLNSPNNSVRKLLLQAAPSPTGVTGGAGTYYITSGGIALSGGQAAGHVPLWAPDSGLSSQPQDFQVANKSAFARVRVSVCTNAVAPAITFTFGLYQIASLAGSGLINVTLGTVLAGSTVAITTPGASAAVSGESTQFSLPTAVGNPYVLGFAASGNTAANNINLICAQLYGYSG